MTTSTIEEAVRTPAHEQFRGAAQADGVISQRPSGPDLVQRAAALVPVLRQRAQAAEALGRIPDETVRDFHQAGLFRVVQPARVGGYQMHPSVMFDVVAEIAKGCASSAWVLANLAIHHQFHASWPARAQDEVWGGSADTLLGSSYIFPRGTAVKVEGGFLLSGQWPFSSGIDPCQWCVLGAVVKDEPDSPSGERRYFMIPRADYSILDTWDVVGLRGTGSKDVAASGVFVPDYRTVSYDEVMTGCAPGLAINPEPLFRLPMSSTGGFVLMPTLYGAARAAADEYVSRSRSSITRVSTSRQADMPAVQDRIAQVEARLDIAEMLCKRAWNDAMDSLAQQRDIDGLLAVRMRRDAAFAAKLVVEAVDAIFAAYGGGGLYESAPIQRIWRDVHAGAAQLGLQWDISGPAYGRVRLGLPSGLPGLSI